MDAVTLGGATLWEAGSKVLDSVSLAIPEGEFWVVTGDARSRPSTILDAMAGRRPLSLGTALVCGRPVRDELSRIGFVDAAAPAPGAVSPLLYARLDAVRRGIHPRPSRIKSTFEELGVEGFSGPIGNLTALAQREARVAAALAARPSVLFIDEPCAGLDGPDKDEMLGFLARAHNGGEAAFVCASRNPDSIGFLADGFAAFRGPALHTLARSSQLRIQDSRSIKLRTEGLARDFVLLGERLPSASLSIEYDRARRLHFVRVGGCAEVELGRALKEIGAVVLEMAPVSLTLSVLLGLSDDAVTEQ